MIWMSQTKNSDFKHDINPKSWLSKYRQTSIGYLTKIGLFYHLISLIPMIIVLIVEFGSTGTVERHFHVSIVQAMTAGPFEETLFFGIPFYGTGNVCVSIGAGIVWSLLHLFNSGTPILNPSDLTYANFAYVVPNIFYSLRTWKSGKGWFSILFHSAWDLIWVLTFTEVTIFTTGNQLYADLWTFMLTIISVSIFLLVYRWRKKRDQWISAKTIQIEDVQKPSPLHLVLSKGLIATWVGVVIWIIFVIFALVLDNEDLASEDESVVLGYFLVVVMFIGGPIAFLIWRLKKNIRRDLR